MKRSPGPWREECDSVVDADGEVVCRKHWSVAYDDPRWMADRPTLAAAPELLAALRSALSLVDALKHDPGGLDWNDVDAEQENARALLTRIDGEP